MRSLLGQDGILERDDIAECMLSKEVSRHVDVTPVLVLRSLRYSLT